MGEEHIDQPWRVWDWLPESRTDIYQIDNTREEEDNDDYEDEHGIYTSWGSPPVPP